MRKRIVQDIPNTPPPSTIFLDDLKAIEDLVRDSMDTSYALTGFHYEFEGKFVVDSIEELKANRGHSKKFKMVAMHRRTLSNGEEVNGDSRIFEVGDLGTAYLNFPSCLRISERDFSHALRSIFEARKRHLRAIIQSIPPETRGMLFAVVGILCVACPGAAIFAIGKLLSTLQLSSVQRSISFGLACAIGLLLGAALLTFWKSLDPFTSHYRVNFYFEREKELEREGWRKGLLEKLLLACLSVLLGVLGTLFVQWVGSGSKH